MSSSDPAWFEQIRLWRERQGLTREDTAGRASISAEALKSYELGRRRPTATTLEAILDALRVERGARARILESVGFASREELLRPEPDGYGFTIEEARAEIDGYAWPSQVNNELMEVVAANDAARALWNVGPALEGQPVASNLMSVASHPDFGGRIRNWDDLIAVGIGIMKGHPRGNEPAPEGQSGYFTKVMTDFLGGDPRYIARLLKLWDTVEPRSPKSRWSVPVIVDHPTAGELRFTLVSSMCNELEGLFFNDWMPLDGATWAGLETLTAIRKSMAASR